MANKLTEQYGFQVSPYLQVPEGVKTKLIEAFGENFKKSITVREWNEKIKISTVADIQTTDQLFRLLNRNGIGWDEFKHNIVFTDNENKELCDTEKEIKNRIVTKKEKYLPPNILEKYQENEHDINHIDMLLLKEKISKKEYLKILKTLNKIDVSRKLNLKKYTSVLELWWNTSFMVKLLSQTKNPDRVVKLIDEIIYVDDFVYWSNKIDYVESMIYIIDEVKNFDKVVKLLNTMYEEDVVAIVNNMDTSIVVDIIDNINIVDIVELHELSEYEDIWFGDMMKFLNTIRSDANIKKIIQKKVAVAAYLLNDKCDVGIITQLINKNVDAFIEILKKYTKITKTIICTEYCHFHKLVKFVSKKHRLPNKFEQIRHLNTK